MLCVQNLTKLTARLNQSDAYEVHWKRWGPYVSERQWVSLTIPLPSSHTNFRELFERTTLPMEMLGTISLSRWPNLELTDGEKTVLPVSRTYILGYLESANDPVTIIRECA